MLGLDTLLVDMRLLLRMLFALGGTGVFSLHCPVVPGGPLTSGRCTLPFTYKRLESDEGTLFDYCPTLAEAVPHGGLQGPNSFEPTGRWCYIAPDGWGSIDDVNTTYIKTRFSTNSFWGRCEPLECDGNQTVPTLSPVVPPRCVVRAGVLDRNLLSWATGSRNGFKPASAGQACSFPFMHQGIEHWDCADKGDQQLRPYGVGWCFADEGNRTYGLCACDYTASPTPSTHVPSRSPSLNPTISQSRAPTTAQPTEGWCFTDDAQQSWGVCDCEYPATHAPTSTSSPTLSPTIERCHHSERLGFFCTNGLACCIDQPEPKLCQCSDTSLPTVQPTTLNPTSLPTPLPSSLETPAPTSRPTLIPSSHPTAVSIVEPTAVPTLSMPSARPTAQPVASIVVINTDVPSAAPQSLVSSASPTAPSVVSPLAPSTASVSGAPTLNLSTVVFPLLLVPVSKESLLAQYLASIEQTRASASALRSTFEQQLSADIAAALSAASVHDTRLQWAIESGSVFVDEMLACPYTLSRCAPTIVGMDVSDANTALQGAGVFIELRTLVIDPSFNPIHAATEIERVSEGAAAEFAAAVQALLLDASSELYTHISERTVLEPVLYTSSVKTEMLTITVSKPVGSKTPTAVTITRGNGSGAEWWQMRRYVVAGSAVLMAVVLTVTLVLVRRRQACGCILRTLQVRGARYPSHSARDRRSVSGSTRRFSEARGERQRRLSSKLGTARPNSSTNLLEMNVDGSSPPRSPSAFAAVRASGLVPSPIESLPRLNPAEGIFASEPSPLGVELVELEEQHGSPERNTSLVTAESAGLSLDLLGDRGEFSIDLSRLRLGAVIGHGGHGRIFRATYCGSDVAVKEIFSVTQRRAPARNSPLFSKRVGTKSPPPAATAGAELEHSATEEAAAFFLEFGHLRLLRHPNIIQLFGAAVARSADTGGARYMLVMELAACSLRDILAGGAMAAGQHGRFGLRETLAIARHICAGGAFIHNLQPVPLIHFDIKPGNVLLDHAGNAKLCDLGIAKYCSRGSGEAAKLTMTSLRGTPSYMAPEMLRGDVAQVSTAVDVFAFGIVLWEILHRRPPHPRAWTVAKLFHKVPVTHMWHY